MSGSATARPPEADDISCVIEPVLSMEANISFQKMFYLMSDFVLF